MRIWDYIKATTVSDIAEALQSFFPDMQNVDVAAHISVIQYLYKATPVEKDGMYIEVHYVPADDLNEEGYWTVSGKYPPGSEQYEEFDGYWALDFIPWDEIKGMDIVEKVAVDQPFLTKAQVVALILYDMTFYGFDPDEVKAKADQLNEMVENIDPDKLISHDDFLDMLESDDDFLDKEE